MSQTTQTNSQVPQALANNFPDKPFVIELCAGSARVTSCARAIGLSDSFGVDHKRIRNCGIVKS